MSEYSIEKVDKLPPSRVRKSVYDRLLEDIIKRGTGFYKIKVSNRKSSSIYSSLSKRVKDREDIKMFSRGGVVYLEVLR